MTLLQQKISLEFHENLVDGLVVLFMSSDEVLNYLGNLIMVFFVCGQTLTPVQVINAL